ncbi:uncharacterized protein LOC121796843 [Salvia splendens]|uniref:uncharacterized protein LOC121796843 n=1 Tax=Salvia splendens TaxID=180675 RepID=UPI001C2558FB|nr:uncharacterized protein LOC121796843 [Salvia splendens]
MDIDPISAYYGSNPGEGEGRRSEEPTSQEEGDEPERTPAAEPIPQERAREEIDLNETARKQGLMTDQEFEALLTEVTREEEEDASEAVREGGEASTRNDPEGPSAKRRGGGEANRRTSTTEETVVRTEEPEPVAPPVLKPKAVKRKLVLRDNPKAVRPKLKRVSQRCLGKWTSSKTKANTAADPVEVLSDEERVTPTKPGEESFPATNLEDASTAAEVVSTTLSDQRDETEQMAGGLDLASESDKPSTQAERKRKRKAPVKRKSSRKKQRTGNIGIVIIDPDQRTPPHRQETNDNDYTASEESESDSDISPEDEEYGAQQLPHNHRELIHPSVERLKYRHWKVKLTNKLIADMKHFSTKDNSRKQFKGG